MFVCVHFFEIIGEATPANPPAALLYYIAPFLESLHPIRLITSSNIMGGAAAPATPHYFSDFLQDLIAPLVESHFLEHHGGAAAPPPQPPRNFLDCLQRFDWTPV